MGAKATDKTRLEPKDLIALGSLVVAAISLIVSAYNFDWTRTQEREKRILYLGVKATNSGDRREQYSPTTLEFSPLNPEHKLRELEIYFPHDISFSDMPAQAKEPNLRIFIKSQLDVIGHTNVGNAPASESPNAVWICHAHFPILVQAEYVAAGLPLTSWAIYNVQYWSAANSRGHPGPTWLPYITRVDHVQFVGGKDEGLRVLESTFQKGPCEWK